MDCKRLLARSFARAQEVLDRATEGMTKAEFAWQAGPSANPPSFILWHLSRVEDRTINHTIRQRPEVWTEGAWHKKLGLPEDPAVTGFNYTKEQVAAFPLIEPETLLAYQKAVRKETLAYVDGLCESDFDCKIATRHDEDNLVATLLGRTVVHVSQHAGQIDFIKGLLRSRAD
ncbi:MAG: DinB family protein [Dehalococcoidia bacterium]|jgi:hypothetical protein|nr:MAG: DinB family protein [Dehalococcoidia bacterium]